MNLTAVMEEIADKLSTFTELNVFSYPETGFHPPAGLVSYPESVDYDEAYANGEMIFTGLRVYMVTDRTDSKSARIQAGKWTDPHGAESVKKFLDSTSYNSCDDVQVKQATFEIFTDGDIDYLCVIFDLDVTGEG